MMMTMLFMIHGTAVVHERNVRIKLFKEYGDNEYDDYIDDDTWMCN